MVVLKSPLFTKHIPLVENKSLVNDFVFIFISKQSIFFFFRCLVYKRNQNQHKKPSICNVCEIVDHKLLMLLKPPEFTTSI